MEKLQVIKATVDGKSVLALVPFSILPEYRRKGIGKALIQQGHKIAKERGYIHSIVLGSEKHHSSQDIPLHKTSG